MINLKKFQDEHGFTPKEAVAVIRDGCKSFSQASYTMAKYPERYGVCLTKNAEKLLKTAYEEPKPKVKRKKANRMSVSFDDMDYKQIVELMEYYNCSTQQEFLRLAVSQVPKPERIEDD